MIKILALGNSFSEDSTAYLEKMTEGLYVRNLYIGGCSLERHSNNLDNEAKEYVFEEHAIRHPDFPEKVSANEIFASEKWDYITVQQASPYSGVVESYEPYLTNVLGYIKALCPTAKVVFHQTWAYPKASESGAFARYNNDQNEMFECIKKATKAVEEKHGLPLIRVGEMIQALRETDLLDDADYTRDSIHLSFNYGRYIAAAVWAKFFGKTVNDFLPENADKEIIEKIKAFIFS